MFGFGKKKSKPEIREVVLPPEDEFSISEDIQRGVDTAFEIGRKWLEEQDAVLYLFFMNEGKPAVAPIKNCCSQDEALGKVRKWASDPNTSAPWFIQMSTGHLEGGTDVNALIAHCAERHHKQGFVLFQKLERADGKLKPVGEVDFMTRIPNDFFK